MTLSSMTGFARANGGDDRFAWVWELRSVNGRGLDVRCRLPSGHDGLETPVRNAIGRQLSRGSVSVNLRAERAAGEATVRINQAVLNRLMELADKLRRDRPGATVSIDGLLNVRGVVEIAEGEEDEATREGREAAMLRDFETALDGLVAARREEGRHLAVVLAEQLDRMEGHVLAAATTAATQPDAIRVRLEAQIAALTERPQDLSQERLAQEVAILAAKADVREELDRLGAHVAAARELVAGGEAAGRRLDFLAQEFNREANTLVSKSADMELTRAGLDLKAVIDQFREQAQNIE
ncbi:MAG: YicC/YloC family endoribonuclease [Alphaproteobacteria bacterium]|nr:YicC/YloC family endoribonuclease [Alphaproteobacteria bacterium]